MKFYCVEGNRQALDGGAMFGNAPKAVWSKWLPADEQNRISLACRALLVEEGDRRILLESGVGAFFEPKLKSRYGVIESEHILLDGLQSLNIPPDTIDTIILSHAHFDHIGGLFTAYQDGTKPQLVFSNANYVFSEEAWNRAISPHSRDKASFIQPLIQCLEDSGRVKIISKGAERSPDLGERFSFSYSEGHTPGMMLCRVEGDQHPITFAADLIPGTPWVHLPITMGYDRFPERLIDEKEGLLKRVIEEQGYLFYTHDPEISCSKIEYDGKRYSAVGPEKSGQRLLWGTE